MAGRIQYELAPLGDTAVEVRWKGLSAEALVAINRAGLELVARSEIRGLIAAVPGFDSLTLHCDPLAWENWTEFEEFLRNHLNELTPDQRAPIRTIEIPVCYGREFALDLEAMASLTGLTKGEIIQRHCSATYTVRMLGFMPGFPYLSGLPKELHAPRREQPRLEVPAGSVAIGGAQAGIYPVVSPGGWQIIGRTPLALFDPQRAEPALLNAGDRVRFVEISTAEFLRIQGAAS